jgi:hypothetical protein
MNRIDDPDTKHARRIESVVSVIFGLLIFLAVYTLAHVAMILKSELMR